MCYVPEGANGIGGSVGPGECSGEHKTLLLLLGIKPLIILSVALSQYRQHYLSTHKLQMVSQNIQCENATPCTMFSHVPAYNLT